MATLTARFSPVSPGLQPGATSITPRTGVRFTPAGGGGGTEPRPATPEPDWFQRVTPVISGASTALNTARAFGLGTTTPSGPPGGAQGTSAALGLLSSGLNLAQVYRDPNASTARKALTTASGVVGGTSAANTLSRYAPSMPTGFLPQNLSQVLGYAAPVLGAATGALGLAEGGGPPAAVPIVQAGLSAASLAGLAPAAATAGAGAVFAIPSIYGAFDTMSLAKHEAEREQARLGPTIEQAQMYSAPLALPVDQMLQDPVFHRIVRLAQQANQGGLQNDIRVGPDVDTQQFLDQVKRIPGFAIQPDTLGPTNLEMIGNLGQVGMSLQGLIRQYSDKLAEAGYPLNPRIANAPEWERPQLIGGEIDPHTGQPSLVQGAGAFDEHGRPRTEWGQNVPVPHALPATGGREAVLDWLGTTARANAYNPDWHFTPEDLAQAVALVGPGALEPYRAEWDEVRQGGAGGTTARSFEEYALRQIGYSRR